MNTPKIRFKGFTDDWEQRKLIDYLDVSNEKNKKGDYKKTDVLSVSGEVGIVNQIGVLWFDFLINIIVIGWCSSRLGSCTIF